MPELPEVETTRRGIAPHLTGQPVVRVIIRQRRLRWPISDELEQVLSGQTIHAVERRAKYLLLRTDRGSVLLHLGMSGSLRILPCATPLRKHDHVDLELGSGYCLRFNDPRRFGCLLWTTDPPERHPLLCDLGPEPLESEFTATHLYTLARGRRVSVKPYLMDSHVVAGVGNIYANEALFMAGIHPARAAGRISLARYGTLADAVREVLTQAISEGGTTLRDFVGGTGEAGYFRQYLRVYERNRLPCRTCGEPIQLRPLGQRATYYCPRCQH